jgi:hypothetical protein
MTLVKVTQRCPGSNREPLLHLNMGTSACRQLPVSALQSSLAGRWLKELWARDFAMPVAARLVMLFKRPGGPTQLNRKPKQCSCGPFRDAMHQRRWHVELGSALHQEHAGYGGAELSDHGHGGDQSRAALAAHRAATRRSSTGSNDGPVHSNGSTSRATSHDSRFNRGYLPDLTCRPGIERLVRYRSRPITAAKICFMRKMTVGQTSPIVRARRGGLRHIRGRR